MMNRRMFLMRGAAASALLTGTRYLSGQSAWLADRLPDLSRAQVDQYGLRRHHEGIACRWVHSD